MSKIPYFQSKYGENTIKNYLSVKMTSNHKNMYRNGFSDPRNIRKSLLLVDFDKNKISKMAAAAILKIRALQHIRQHFKKILTFLSSVNLNTSYMYSRPESEDVTCFSLPLLIKVSSIKMNTAI